MTKNSFTISTRHMTVESAITRSEDNNEITVIFSTGYKGLRSDVYESFYEELEMTESACDLSRLKKGAPFLIQHESNVTKTIGVVRDAWIENNIGYAKIQLSKRKDVQDIIQDIKDGILSNISVGYTIQQYSDVSQRGDKKKTLLATKWLPQEISLVAVGFDPHSQILRQTEQTNQVTITETRMEFSMMSDEDKVAHIQLKMEAAQPLTDEEQSYYDQKMKPQPEPQQELRSAPVVDIQEVKRQALAEFKERSQAIQTAVRASGLDMKLADQFINEDLSVEQASKRIFEQLESNKKQIETKSQKENTKMTKQLRMEQALLNRINANKFKVDADNEYKQSSLMKIAGDLVERKPGESDTVFAQRAIATADLTDLLSNIANKILAEGDGQEKYAFEKIASEISLRDFKATPIVRVGNSGLAVKSSETGDYAAGTMSDSKETITLVDRGLLFTISWQAIMNDDLNVLKQIGQKAPEMGRKDIEKQVINVLNSNPVMADGNTLFHASHGNLITGGAAPSEAGLDAANQLMKAFVDESGEPMDLSTKYLIVMPKHEVAARKLAAQITASSSANVNPFGGQIEVIVSSRLTQKATKDVWYLSCDPNEFAPLVFATLEGQGSNPEVQAQEDFNSKNLKVRVSQPSGAAAASYKGIVQVVLA